MAEKKFSASVKNMMENGPANRTRQQVSGQKKQKVMTFNHEQEDKIRDKSRKVVYLVQQLKEEKMLPVMFGLLLKNETVKKSLGVDKPTLDEAYLEYDKKKFDVIKSQLIQSLSDDNIPIVKQVDATSSHGTPRIRLLINIRELK